MHYILYASPAITVKCHTIHWHNLEPPREFQAVVRATRGRAILAKRELKRPDERFTELFQWKKKIPKKKEPKKIGKKRIAKIFLLDSSIWKVSIFVLYVSSNASQTTCWCMKFGKYFPSFKKKKFPFLYSISWFEFSIMNEWLNTKDFLIVS